MSCGVAILVIALASAPAARADGPQFVIQDLGTLGGVESYAFDVNARDEVVGQSFIPDGRRRGFLWTGGRMIQLPSLGGLSSANAISDNGWIVGQSCLAPDFVHDHATLWIDRVAHDLGVFEDGLDSVALDVNQLGHVVGWATRWNGEFYEPRPVLWEGGRMIELPTPAGGEAEALGVNEQDDIVGWTVESDTLQATLWRNGQPVLLGSLTDKGSEACAINARGDVAGSAWNAAIDYDLALWSRGAIQDLGSAGGVGFCGGINDGGIVVGYGYDYIPGDGAGFIGIWVEQGELTLLPAPIGHVMQLTSVNNLAHASGIVTVDDQFTGTRRS